MMVREELRDRLRKQPCILFAYLFGSRASGKARHDSDWDVAVYVDVRTAAERFELRRRLLSDLRAASTVDLVVLNDAPALLGHRALLGEPLFVRDKAAFVRYFVKTLAESEDDRYFREIHMSARKRRLGKLEELLREVRVLGQHDFDTFRSNALIRASAERWLQLAAKCTLDLTHHLIADRGWRSPSTNREAYSLLARHGVLTKELASQMAGWAGLRNVLVHVYLEVDAERIYEALTAELDQLEAFAVAVAKAARS